MSRRRPRKKVNTFHSTVFAAIVCTIIYLIDYLCRGWGLEIERGGNSAVDVDHLEVFPVPLCLG